MSNLFSIPNGQAFLDALATAVLSGDLPALGGPAPDPLDLPAITIMLPTRRATRALADAFLRVSGQTALLLPRIIPISEGDDDGGLLAGLAGVGGLAASDFDIPPAIDPLERRLVLARLVMQWSMAVRRAREDDDSLTPMAGARTAGEAVTLSSELARLIDMVETEGATLGGLTHIVPDEHARHWQDTLQFLAIVTRHWPAYLSEIGLLSPADRRNQVLRAHARRLAAAPPSGPVIVAGITGSIPATVDIMKAVASLPNGAIVLPGLDVELDGESWSRILPNPVDKIGHPEHPQYGLAKLLKDLGADRQSVTLLGQERAAAAPGSRSRLLSEALRPSSTTDLWRRYIAGTPASEAGAAVSGISLIEAPTPAEEAEAVTLVLRKALETPGITAALVSPDRRLARRVAIRLEAYGIKIDDSAGTPFAKTPPGAFLELVLDAVRRDFEPATVVALLGHPLARLGRSARDLGFAARSLEIAAFRALYLGRGLGALAPALDRAEAEQRRRSRATRRLWAEDWQRARSLAEDLTAAYEPLTRLFETGRDVSLRDLASAHACVAEALARRPPAEESELGGNALWQGEAGETASLLFARMASGSTTDLDLPAADYPDVFRALFGMENVRPRGPVHPRLAIWGPFESRLQQPDVVVLGSLNDGTWPEAADPGPWLNRPMRHSLGLPSPEERIGFAAHDFWSLMGAKQVVMTRSLKADGTPTVESRWLLRLKALLEGAGASAALKPEEPWLAWVRDRDRSADRKPYLPPEPRPALALRPRELSVSSVESWIANPYALYADKILNLQPLPALGLPPDGALRGSVLHEALNAFAKAFSRELPDDVAACLMKQVETVLEAYAGDARVAAFWLPRFRRFANWFAETEPVRRQGLAAIFAEAQGSLSLDGVEKPFRLTARADRIDALQDGYVVTDYKTGTPPDKRQVAEIRAPQLPLEAAILLHGGFPGLDGPVSALRYIRASGGEPPGETFDVVTGSDDIARLADEALEDLRKLVITFDDERTPYRALRRPRFSYDYDDYAHLARVDEWSPEGDAP